MKLFKQRRISAGTILRLLAIQTTALLWMGGLAVPAQEPPMEGGPGGPGGQPPSPQEQSLGAEAENNQETTTARKPAAPTATRQMVLSTKMFSPPATSLPAAPVTNHVAVATTNPPAATAPKPIGNTETNHPAESASQEAEAGTGTGLQAFKIVYERNIFDPNRGPRRSRRAGDAPKPVKIEVFSLVGTLMSEKGAYAFFDGSDAQYRAALQTSNTIGGFTVATIAQNFVTLSSPSNTFELNMYMQMRRQDEGDWELTEATGSFNSANSPAPAAAAVSEESGGGSDAGADDVMKRLMKKREEELKK